MPVDSNAKGSFWYFKQLCLRIGSDSSRTAKTQAVSDFVTDNYTGDLKILLKLLLPKVSKRVFNMSVKRMIKLSARVLSVSEATLDEAYTTGVHAGDIGKVVSSAFALLDDSSFPHRTSKTTVLSMKQVDDFLDDFTKLTKLDDQSSLLRKVAMLCTANDLELFVRQLDRDLKIDAGSKTVLDGLHKDAYKTYGRRADIDYLVSKLSLSGKNATFTIGSELMSPIRPMLASACKSFEAAFKKCPSGVFFAELKYDGERVQVHFDGSEWKFYSRSLKPVADSKISHVRSFVPKSCPDVESVILDAEILMVDTVTGNPLPFGSLGVHKKEKFANASPCLFVFDILHFNGESLLNKPLCERRKLLEEKFTPIENRIHLSQLTRVSTAEQLQELMEEAIGKNQEGLVVKDSHSIYKPNARHWLKIKRDYLADGAMADSADLVVLAAFKGSGRHGGLYSTMLMGVLKDDVKKFVTVCKVHNGLSDELLKHYTQSIEMVEYSPETCPRWLQICDSMKPDWVCVNPKKSPVFEVTGFEFTETKRHTATDHLGKPFSIRFPRVTRVRDDKNYKTATTLTELRALVQTSRSNPLSLMKKKKGTAKGGDSVSGKKRKTPMADVSTKACASTTKMKSVSPPTKKAKLNNFPLFDMFKSKATKKKPSATESMLKPKSAEDASSVSSGMEGMATDTDEKNEEGAVETESPLPTHPKVATDSRRHCQYDADCYRKNPMHFFEFQHPLKEQLELETATQRAHDELKKAESKREQIIAEGIKEADEMRLKMIEGSKEEANEYFAKRRKKIKRDQTDAYDDIQKLYHEN